MIGVLDHHRNPVMGLSRHLIHNRGMDARKPAFDPIFDIQHASAEGAAHRFGDMGIEGDLRALMLEFQDQRHGVLRRLGMNRISVFVGHDVRLSPDTALRPGGEVTTEGALVSRSRGAEDAALRALVVLMSPFAAPLRSAIQGLGAKLIRRGRRRRERRAHIR